MLKINRNIFWSNLFIDLIIIREIKYACISPGSRSTPLTFVLATSKSIKSFPIIDERSSAFFALGLAKKTQHPSLIITTSGTAVAETYPAIIEAYQSRTPLIVCTADRPSRLRGTGANQTINQKNIFKNHIRFSVDIPLMEINKSNIKNFIKTISDGLDICLFADVGPVHFNFQFEKPFEPYSHTDEIKLELIDYSIKLQSEINQKPSHKLEPELELEPEPELITIGSGNFNKEFIKKLDRFSIKSNIPIFADFGSGLRSSEIKLKNLISNYDSLVRVETFQKIFKPKTVIHFGRNITSSELEDFLVRVKSKRIVVNEFGDRFDSTKRGKIIKANPNSFIGLLISKKNNLLSQTLERLIHLDSEIENIKSKIFSNVFSEVGIVKVLIEKIPSKSNLFIGNSLPIRDFDFYIGQLDKKINIFTNRGASGIDGLISTAAGIGLASKKPTYLVIGDLSFYYDMNSLLLIKKYNIPLKIILINNGGGRIFDYLPISQYKDLLKDFFTTPIELNFKKVANVFDIDFFSAENQNELEEKLNFINKAKSSVILEVKVNPLITKSLKFKYRTEVNKLVSKFSS